MHLVRRIGFAVLGLQFLGLAVWSNELSSHFAMGPDFLGYGQAWFQMAHGHLDPYVTAWGENFLSDHGSFVVVLLAPLWWLWPHAVTLLWVQSAAIVAGELVAFVWMCEVATEFSQKFSQRTAGPPSVGPGPIGGWRRHLNMATALPLLGLTLLVANPWVYWTASFDYHLEVMGSAFAMLLAYDIAHHRRRAWLWLVLTALSGDVAITYIFGVGLSAVIAGRAWRNKGLILMAVPVAALAVVSVSGLSVGSNLAGTYIINNPSVHDTAIGLKGWRALVHSILFHPTAYFGRLRGNLVNLYANVAPAGGIGLFCAWGFGVPAIVLLQNNLTASTQFSLTSFQNFPVYLFVSFGTIVVLSRIALWRAGVALVVGAVILVSAIGWSVTWFPKTSTTWLRVSQPAAALLATTLAHLPPDDEVVASHGIIGAFAERDLLYEFVDPLIPVHSRHVWFIDAPAQGINTEPVQSELARIGWLAGSLHAQLVAHGSGVWVFRLSTPSNVIAAAFPNMATCQTIPAWAVSGAAGRPIVRGPASTWVAGSTGNSGYVVSGDYWRLSAGNYVAGVNVQAEGPISVQVWDADRDRLVAQRDLPQTYGPTLVAVPFSSPGHLEVPLTQGAGPFRVRPDPPPYNDQLEVRIYSPGGTPVSASSITVVPSSQSSQLATVAGHVC
jgi:hypothetical protein